MRPGPVVCVVGPTATGKSEIADAVAAALGSHVISADAMQVYRGMDIGTAKMPEARRTAPLALVDMVDVGEAYSAALYQRDARAVIDSELRRPRTPVLCGGTGLYVRAAVDEMEFPKGRGTSERRRYWEARAEEIGEEELWRELDAKDPASAARIHPHNVRRVIRALEMADEGVSYAEQASGLHERVPVYEVRMWGLTRDRHRLYETIDDRVDAMLAEGLVDEVRSLREMGLEKAPTAAQAIGYAEILGYLRGECSLVEASREMKKRTRHLAKRQFTWFRGDRRVRWLDVDELGREEIVDRILSDAALGPAAPGEAEGSEVRA